MKRKRNVRELMNLSFDLLIFMKRTIILLAIVFGPTCFSQTKKSDYNADFMISYKMDFKEFVNSELTQSANTALIINNQGSLFTLEAMMNLNKIQQERDLTIADAFLNKSPFYYLIKSDGVTTEHYETIGSDSYKFKEKLDFDWKLINKDTVIGGYSCKKAVMNYSGRQWNAWYASEIPLSVGPYKFRGLPGLIMNIKDSDSIFNFTVSEIKKGNFITNPQIENYFIKDGGKPFEYIDIRTFYEIRDRFYKMSVNEQLQFMNRENVAEVNFVVETVEGKKPRLNSKPKARNFIEIHE